VDAGDRLFPVTAPEPLRLYEAVEALEPPGSPERFSPLTGAPVLVVDLRDDAPPLPAERALRFGAALERLACPSIAIGGDAASPPAVAARFDLLVRTPEDAAPLVRAIAEAPLASLGLVQLLRLGDFLLSDAAGMHHALVAESLVYSTLQAGPEFAAWLERRGAALRSAPSLSSQLSSQPPPPSGPAVRAERWGDELVLSLDRPARHNAFSVEMRDALVEGLAMAVADDRVTRVLLRGEGPSFCSGGDLAEFGTLPDPATANAVRAVRHPARLLLACGGRVEARVHGACIGAGVELPAFAARVVADESAFFQLPELSMGLVPGAGGTASLPRRIGRQRTAWLALSGERIDAATALRIGLVDAIAS